MSEYRLADSWVGIMEKFRFWIANPKADADSVSSILIPELDRATAHAREMGQVDGDIRESLFAVVAWIDELAMTTHWPGADAWRRSPLQRHYFSTTRAGVEFFDRLDRLSEGAAAVLEVYGIALLAGFTGRYATRPGGELTEYRIRCLQRIAKEGHMQLLDTHGPLFDQPPDASVAGRAQIRRRRLPGFALALLILLPAIALTALYVVLDQPLATQATVLMGTR